MAEHNDTPAEDTRLFEQIKDGDREAWEQLVELYYNPLFAFILSMVKNEATAEELVQDIFVNIWTKREKIDITISLKAYLFRASRNHTLNYLKRRNFEQNYQRNLASTSVSYNYETEKTVHFNELQQKLEKAIESLPESCREIFKLSRFEELTYKEIAETLDIPARTVHYQIGLALKELRHKLRDYYQHKNLPAILLMLMLLLPLLQN